MTPGQFFGAPSHPRMARALRSGVGALALLGLTHAEAEWTPRLAIYAVGRSGVEAAAPYGLWLLATVASLGVFVGAAPRASAGVLCASLAGLHALAPQVYHNNYYVLWLLVAITALDGPRAHRAPWSREEGEATTSLVPRLVQVQLALIYLLSVLAKLLHPWWREGGAVVRWIVTERVPQSGVRGLVNPALSPLLSEPALAAAAQSGILCLEALLPLMLFSRRWRTTAFVVGASMHVVMQEWLFPQLFTFLMLLGYYAFAPAGDRGWSLSLSDARPSHRRLARALPGVDWLGRVRVELRPEGGLRLVSPDGVTREGVSGLWWLAALCPPAVLAYAAFALIAPRVTEVLGVPRAGVENVVVMVVGGIGLIPGKRSSQTPQGDAAGGS